jgi:hypothetical protein
VLFEHREHICFIPKLLIFESDDECIHCLKLLLNKKAIYI